MFLSRYIGICADQASDDEPRSCLLSAHANDFINGGAAWQINNWIPKPAYYQSSFYSSKNTAHFVSPGAPAGVSVSTHDVPLLEAPGPRLLGAHHGQHLAPARVKLLARLPLLVCGPTGVQLLLSEGKCLISYNDTPWWYSLWHGSTDHFIHRGLRVEIHWAVVFWCFDLE